MQQKFHNVQTMENQKVLNNLYLNQSKWVKGQSLNDINENLIIYLKTQAIDLDYNQCLTNKDIEDYILNDRIEGVKKFKVNATPTIIINGKKFDKSLNYKNLKNLLKN